MRFAPLVPPRRVAPTEKKQVQEVPSEKIAAPSTAPPQQPVRRINDFFDELRQEPKPKPETHCVVIQTMTELREALEACRKRGRVAFDVETTGLDHYLDHVVSIQFTCEVGMGYYVSIAHSYAGDIPNLPEREVFHAFSSVFEDDTVDTIAHNLKFDYRWFYKAGYREIARPWDTMIAAHVIDENRPKYGLKFLVRKLLNIDMTTFQSLGVRRNANDPNSGKYKDFSEVPLEIALPYACADVDMTLRLYEMFKPHIDHSFDRIFYKIEMPLVPVLARMEHRGVLMDPTYMSELGNHLNKELVRLRAHLDHLAMVADPHAIERVLADVNEDNWYKRPGPEGERRKKAGFVETFEWESTAQIVKLFEQLGIDTGRRTGGKNRSPTHVPKMSTDKKALLGMARRANHAGHKIAKTLLGWRQLDKIKKAFTDTLPLKLHPVTGRIHPSFNQDRVVTARLSCSEPNLQQIPKSGICAIRYPFMPKPGYVFIQNDFSQVELRILAHISGDESMLEAFRTGVDVHALTALQCFADKLPPGTTIAMLCDKNNPLSIWRSRAKAITFGIVYGIGPKSLAEMLDIPVSDAANYIEAFLGSKPKVRHYCIEMQRYMERFGYVCTPMGRRRHILKGPDGRRPFGWERKAANFPIQSASAEIMKHVMAALDNELYAQGLPAEILIQIHDELIIEAKEDVVDKVLPIVHRLFERAIEDLGFKYDVPLEAPPTVQARWNIEAKKCAKCSRWSYIAGPNKTKVCIHCDNIKDPGIWDIDATLETILEAAIDEEDEVA